MFAPFRDGEGRPIPCGRAALLAILVWHGFGWSQADGSVKWLRELGDIVLDRWGTGKVWCVFRRYAGLDFDLRVDGLRRAILIRTRKASLTASESGKNSATSGLRRITFVPAAYLAA